MKKDETALGEERDQSNGRKMEEDVGVTVCLLQTSGTQGWKGILLLDELQSARTGAVCGLVKPFIVACLEIAVCCPYLAFINVLLLAHLFSGPRRWPCVSEFKPQISGSTLSSSNVRIRFLRWQNEFQNMRDQ